MQKSYLRTQLTTAVHGAALPPTFETAQLQRTSHSGYLPVRPRDADTQIARYLRGKQQPQDAGTSARAPKGLYSPCHDIYEARVVEVYPGKYEDPLGGRLHHVYLNFEYESQATHSDTLTYTAHTRFALSTKNGQPIHYTALSYVWGDPVFDCKIFLEGGDKAITRSLHTAIMHLRHSTESVVLWIDQIAINQDDPGDKAHQIQLMSFVYRRAFNTVIWLGEEPDKGAFAALESLRLTTYGRFDDDLVDTAGGHAAEIVSANEIISLRKLLERPWFERTWTIQEAILSLEPYFMTGSSTVHWEDFAGHCVSIADRSVVSNDTQPGAVNVSGVNVAAELWAMRSFFQSVPSKNLLLDALVETRYAKVSNPLDKIYGVLGLCQTQDLVPDYNISSHELFRQVALKILGGVLDRLSVMSDANSAGLGPLHHDLFRMFSCIDHESECSDSLPSWAPNWTRPRVTTPLGFSGQVWYKAGAGPIVHNVLCVNRDQRSLTVSTVICGEVTDLAPIVTNARLDPTEVVKSSEGLRACIDFASTSPSSSAPVPFESFCHTLVAGREDSGNGLFNAKHTDQYIEVLSLLCDTLSGRCPTFPDQTYSKRQRGGHLTLENLKSRSVGRAFQSLRKTLSIAILNRRLCLVDGNRIALVPRHSRPGDVVAVFSGSNVPFLLRPAGKDTGKFVLLGECYVHDLMEGEVLAHRAKRPEPIVLI